MSEIFDPSNYNIPENVEYDVRNFDPERLAEIERQADAVETAPQIVAAIRDTFGYPETNPDEFHQRFNETTDEKGDENE